MVFAAKVSEVPDWGKKLVQLGQRSVLLVKSKGVMYACENECPHQSAPMQGGLLKEAGFISCPRHGYRFDLTSGACKEHPEYRLKTYTVEVRGDEVYVEVPGA